MGKRNFAVRNESIRQLSKTMTDAQIAKKLSISRHIVRHVRASSGIRRTNADVQRLKRIKDSYKPTVRDFRFAWIVAALFIATIIGNGVLVEFFNAAH